MAVSVAELAEGKRSVLGRAFEILECFMGGEAEQSFSRLCSRTGLPPATVHRTLAILIEWDALERASRGRYRLGRRLWRLGKYVPSSRLLKEAARPCLVDLHTATREIAVLASVDHDRMIVADVIAGRGELQAWSAPLHLPVGSSAPGLVTLACLPPEDAARLLEVLPARRRAIGPGLDFTMRQRLSDIRREGTAVVPDGGHVWVSAPVFDDTGRIRTTLSSVVPSERLNVPALGRVLRDAAQAVTHALREHAESAC